MEVTMSLKRLIVGVLALAALVVAPLVPLASAATPPKALLGMSAPNNLWSQRVSEVQAKGGHLQARRVFVTSFTGSLSIAQTACNAGQSPVVSFKTGSYSWAQVANGAADSALASLNARLNALGCPVFAVIHHEPNGDGSSSDYAKMQAHALPILGGTDTDAVTPGVIVNGFWFNSNAQGLSDSELRAWLPSSVLAVAKFIGADTYQLKSGAEEPASKMRNMEAWAARTPGVNALAVGEFNSTTAAGIKGATDELASSPIWAFGCVWNTDLGSVTHLSGARLTTFQVALRDW
jgi:hypothetical protein